METATLFLVVLAGFVVSVLLALVAEDLIFRGLFELVYVSRSPSVESEKNPAFSTPSALPSRSGDRKNRG